MKEVISKDPNVELIQLEGDKAALAELIINKRKKLIDDLSNIDGEKEKANKYINEYFGKFKLLDYSLIFSEYNDNVCDMPTTDKWYEDFASLLNECKIENLYYSAFKIVLKAYAISANIAMIAMTKKDQINEQLMFAKKLVDFNDLSTFNENLFKEIKTNCIENKITKQTDLTEHIMLMIYQVLYNIYSFDVYKEETDKYINILNSLMESIASSKPINKKHIPQIKNLIYYRNDNESSFVNTLRKLCKKYNSSFAIDETNYTVGRVVKLSSLKEDNKNNSIIYVDGDKGLTALHIGAINDFVSKVTKKILSNDEIESEIASLIAFGDVSSQIMIEEAMEKLRKQNFTHGVNKVLILLSNKLKEKDSKKVMHK